MATTFKKAAAGLSPKKLRTINTGSFRILRAKLFDPLRKIGMKLVLFVARAWLWHALRAFIRRYKLVIALSATGLGAGIIGLAIYKRAQHAS